MRVRRLAPLRTLFPLAVGAALALSGAAWAAEPTEADADEPAAAEPLVHEADQPESADTGDGDLSPMAAEKLPKTQAFPIDLSGYFWVDTGYMKRENARTGQYDQEANYMQGRFVLAADYHQQLGDFYAAARTEFIGFVNEFTKSQFEAHVLDAFVQLGQPWWDVQVGRFLAWEVYHRGSGIELFTAEETGALNGPALYWLQTTRGYRNESGQAAIHLYPADFIGVEIAAIYGQEQNQNNYGVRPAIDLRYEGLRLMLGFEYYDQSPQTSADKVSTTLTGFAARLQYELADVFRVGASVARSELEAIRIDGEPDAEKSGETLSFGGYADVDFWISSVGLGYNLTIAKNDQGEENKHHQAFVSYLVRLPIDGLSVKAVYGYALAAIEDIDIGASWENTMHSFRLRLAYDFR